MTIYSMTREGDEIIVADDVDDGASGNVVARFRDNDPAIHEFVDVWGYAAACYGDDGEFLSDPVGVGIDAWAYHREFNADAT